MLSGLGEFPDRWREDLLVTWLAVTAACHTAKQPLCISKTIPIGLSVIRLWYQTERPTYKQKTRKKKRKKKKKKKKRDKQN